MKDSLETKAVKVESRKGGGEKENKKERFGVRDDTYNQIAKSHRIARKTYCS